MTILLLCPVEDDTRAAQEGEDRAREEVGLPEAFVRDCDLEMDRARYLDKVLRLVHTSLF